MTGIAAGETGLNARTKLNFKLDEVINVKQSDFGTAVHVP